MKKLRIVLVSSASVLVLKMCLLTTSAVLFSGCSKTTSDTSASSTTTTAEPNNGLTLQDNDTTYVETNGAGCTLTIGSTSTLLFQSSLVAAFPISLAFTATGPAGGIGTYKYTPIDSSTTVLSGHPFYFSESFPGGETYKVDSVMVNITKAASDTVTGTFTMWVRNTSKSETVTGTINCDYATIIN